MKSRRHAEPPFCNSISELLFILECLRQRGNTEVLAGGLAVSPGEKHDPSTYHLPIKTKSDCLEKQETRSFQDWQNTGATALAQ